MREKSPTKKTTARTTVKDLPPKKTREVKVKGGSDEVYRPGCNINHNETLLLDARQAAR
ncbi:MAG TPA: hypothetical protein VGL09_06000 [Methylomirabilota bacterium]|jgi:hypothetical protein